MLETLFTMKHPSMAFNSILTLSYTSPSLREIIEVCASVSGLSVMQITMQDRSPMVSRARMIYFYAASSLTGQSLDQMAAFCGGRHHTTALHAIHRVAAAPSAFEPHLSLILTRLNGPIGPGGMPTPRHRKG